MFGEVFVPVERHDKLLAITSQLAEDIRKAVFNEFGYTCSAGIAHNKLLAKLASALNKPNGQTVVPLAYVSATMDSMSIRKIRNFGGNVAKALDEVNIKTVNELKKLSMEELEDLFGEYLLAIANVQ